MLTRRIVSEAELQAVKKRKEAESKNQLIIKSLDKKPTKKNKTKQKASSSSIKPETKVIDNKLTLNKLEL